ncbi:hypothetical protein K3495_g4605 [Podosphaera aphanis]|nr:hypothetical protein K3495_g4605 [Podosphaera aphanis]
MSQTEQASSSNRIAFNQKSDKGVSSEEDPFRKRGLRRSPLSSDAKNTNALKRTESKILRARNLDTKAKIPLSTGIRALRKTSTQIFGDLQDDQDNTSPKPPDRPNDARSTSTDRRPKLSQLDFHRNIEYPVSPTHMTSVKQAQGRVNPEPEVLGGVTQTERAYSPEFPNLNVKKLIRQFPEDELDQPEQLNRQETVSDAPNLGGHSMPDQSSPSLGVVSEKQNYFAPRHRDSAQIAPDAQESVLGNCEHDDLEKRLPNERNEQTSFPDLLASKRHIRDSLARELEQLHADVVLAKAENERLRLSNKDSSSYQKLDQEVCSMLLRATEEKNKAENKNEEKSIFKNLSAFLPFSSRRRRLASTQMKTTFLDKVPAIGPQVMENSLPYLQAFTPLTWSSKIAILQAYTSAASNDAVQTNAREEILQQIVTASHPQGFFSARLSFTVDVASRTVRSLSLLKLPACAEVELGTFIRSENRDTQIFDRGNIDREIGVVCYAMGRWVEVSLQRARFWSRIVQRYATPEARRLSLKSKNQSKRKRKQAAGGADKEGGEDLDTSSWTLKQLLPHLGRSTLCISNSTASTSINSESDDPHGVELLFEWNLKFDWTGEVTSHLAACVRAPKLWHESDAHHGFHRIPDLFRRLVREKGALAAVAAVISLTLGDHS